MLAAVRLGNEQLGDVHTQFLGVETVERVLGINDSGDAALFLHLCHGVDSEGGLTGRLRTVDLDDTSFGVTTYAQGVVQTQTTGRDNGHILNVLVTQFHNGTFAIFFINLCHRGLQCFELVCIRCLFLCHNISDLRFTNLRCTIYVRFGHFSI